MVQLILAAILFLGTHIGISSSSLRNRLTALLGERGYLVFYSLVAVVCITWLITLYNGLPRFDYLWMPSPQTHMVARVLMPFSLILAVGAFLVKNPTAVGAEALLSGAGPAEASGAELAKGVLRITRHPFQWGVVLWSVAHVLANGDTHSVVFFATFGLLAGMGSVALDRKRAAASSSAWESFARATSNLPFLAILQRRNRLQAGELWLPVLLGLILYLVLLRGHAWVSGVRIY